jgi:O-antigen ligase
LGIAGLVLWYLTYPKKLFFFPRIKISHPLFWIITFAIYAFIVSLLAINIVSIVYSFQFLFYAVVGTVLMKRYRYNFYNTNHNHARSIFFAIAIVFSVGILVSVLTGPIYPQLAQATQRQWAGFLIQHGVGFSEAYSIAALPAIFFVAACIYLYRDKIWKKLILLSLLLFALLATLSRGAIFSFAIAMALAYCLDNLVPFIKRGNLKISVFKNIGFVAMIIGPLILITMNHSTTKALLRAIRVGFGLTPQHDVVSKDMAARFSLWTWGLDNWASGGLLKMIFGGGFRSSMTVGSAWQDAHNVYITILGDFGIVGLALFLAALFVAFFRYVRLFLTGKAQSIQKFGLLVLVALSIDNMTGPYFYSPISLFLLIFTFAVTL